MAEAWLGQTIGNWRIDEKIGEGGCGQVFRGVDVMLDRQVAIKVLHPKLAERPDIAERFRVEAHAMARLSHPNVATVYSFHRESDTYVMVMEFVEGDTFEALLKREGPMPAARAVPLILQALEGVDHAHRGGIVHRDLKATNLMLNEAGVVKVMDFGIAQVIGRSGEESDSRPVGTPEYMSPEQVRGEALDGRADVYALGVLLFKLLTGRLPIRGDTPTDVMRAQLQVAPRPIRALAPSLAEPVARVVEQAMAKSAGARFADARAFRAALVSISTAFEINTETSVAPISKIDEDADSDVGPTQVMLEPPLSVWSPGARRVLWGGAGTALALVVFGLWLGQSGRVSARATGAAPPEYAAGPHRLPPLPMPPPVGFAEWPFAPGELSADATRGVVLGPADFAKIPQAPLLPLPITPYASNPPDPSSETLPGQPDPTKLSSTDPPKKERARRAAKPQNPPGRTVPAPAAKAPSSEPGALPKRDSGWVIRR